MGTLGQQEQATEAPVFAIHAADARLTGVLFSALLSTRWPSATVEIADAGGSELADGETLIVSQTTGRLLSVFLHPPNPSDLSRRLQTQGCSVMMFGASREELESALTALDGGPSFVSADLLQLLAVGQATTKTPTLTSREREVLRLVARGLSNREVAAELTISPNTVRTHLRSISAQLGLTSRGKLAAKARELKLG